MNDLPDPILENLMLNEMIKNYEATTWLLVATGLLSVLSALLGYTAIALESRCLLASVNFDVILTKISLLLFF